MSNCIPIKIIFLLFLLPECLNDSVPGLERIPKYASFNHRLILSCAKIQEDLLMCVCVRMYAHIQAFYNKFVHMLGRIKRKLRKKMLFAFMFTSLHGSMHSVASGQRDGRLSNYSAVLHRLNHAWDVLTLNGRLFFMWQFRPF